MKMNVDSEGREGDEEKSKESDDEGERRRR